MGTDKRARQKQLHKSRLEEARKAAEAAARRRRLMRWGIPVVIAVIAIVVASAVGNDDSTTTTKSSKSTTSTSAAPGATTTTASNLKPATLKGPGAGKSITGATPCPKADGSSARTTSFAKEPPTCIDPAKTYTATFDTTKGSFTVTLDAKAAPVTVNNFVVLSRYHFYDGIPFHRIVPDFVIQAGDPSDTPNGGGGPGYTIKEEPPASKTYAKYDLAMAKTSEAHSTGSQFFVVTGDPAALNQVASYSLFGKVTAGTDVVDAIGSLPTAGPSNDSPTEQIDIKKITITES